MGQFFSDVVEQALQNIYYDVRTGRGQESFRQLEQASASGDGDASCILARCLCGYQYTWSGHGFPEDDRRAEKLMRKSVEQGSAVGVLVALRSGELSPAVERTMGFSSLQEAFEVVREKAEMGDPFCQYTVGNVYFWWDFLRIQGKDKNSFPSHEAFKAYLRENISQCEEWFWKAFRGGMYHAGNNLNQYYRKGDEDIILPQPQKAEGIFRIGAERGYPTHQYTYAKELDKAGRKEEALEWHKKAAEGGELDSWYYVGVAYEEGRGGPRDVSYAAKCYEKGLSSESIGCRNRLGALYMDGNGVPQDYQKGVKLLEEAYRSGNKWGLVYLGRAYAKGLGVPYDHGKARELLEKVTWENPEKDYLLGMLYARGLGVPEDIKKGVEYLKKAPGREDAREELAKYKKTLFGKWVRR